DGHVDEVAPVVRDRRDGDVVGLCRTASGEVLVLAGVVAVGVALHPVRAAALGLHTRAGRGEEVVDIGGVGRAGRRHHDDAGHAPAAVELLDARARGHAVPDVSGVVGEARAVDVLPLDRHRDADLAGVIRDVDEVARGLAAPAAAHVRDSGDDALRVDLAAVVRLLGRTVELDVERRLGSVGAQHVAVLAHRAVGADAHPAQSGDEIARLDARLVGDRTGRDGRDPDPEPAVLAGHALAVDAEAQHALARGELLDDVFDLVAVDGEVVVVGVLAGVVHADHAAVGVD